ncbi:MAG: GNAT family N-acetyltransferase [Clostridia bacterium]|nr:GNAT family N-acetyltransferase [Clostridia bacterium]
MKRPALTYARLCQTDMGPVSLKSARSPLGADIYTVLRTDGSQTDDLLWVGKDAAGKPQRVLFCCASYRVVLSPSRAWVCRRDKTDAALFCPPEKKDLLCVLLKPNAVVRDSTARALTGPALLSFFETLAADPGQTVDAQESYVTSTRRINRGLSSYFAVFEGDTPVSGGGIVAKNEKYALIGDLYTNPAYRGGGYASAVLCACEAAAAAENLTPVLYCDKKHARFYKKRGWRRVRKNEL